jgi:hypothetical protein
MIHEFANISKDNLKDFFVFKNNYCPKLADPEEHEILDILSEVTEILNCYSKGQLSGKESDILTMACKTGYIYIEQSKKLEKFNIGFNFHINMDIKQVSFRDFILITGILLPMFHDKSEIKLRYTKKCITCGKFYQAKGKKAFWCSERCRSQYRRIHNTNIVQNC